jgi:hypothetical protein
MQRTTLTTLALLLGLALSTGTTHGAEIGHYVPGLLNIRDFAMPEPGLYGVLYNYFYSTDRLNDRNGNEINSVTLNPRGGPGVTLNVDVDVDVYALAPTLIWVSPWKLLGAKYGALILPSFTNMSVGASLATETGRGIDPDTSQFGVGDLFVQPLWLGWTLTHWDFAFGYGFYAPTGKYDTSTVTLPGGATVTAEAADNIGLGFWTHQLQGAVTWYPWANKATAVVTALTYEIHTEKEDFDLTPGQNLTWNWGLSQFLPLSKDQKLLLEAGVTGYSSWQITDDSGNDPRNTGVKDQVHAVGGQLGLTYVPWFASLNVRYFGEFEAQDRFQGQVVGVSVAKKF